MTHQQIFEMFKKVTGFDDSRIDRWFSLGKYAIRVKFKDRTEYIFKYKNPRKWRLETFESYLYGYDYERGK